MRLIDLDAEKDYLLDGRYVIKAPLVAHFEVIGSKFMRKKWRMLVGILVVVILATAIVLLNGDPQNYHDK